MDIFKVWSITVFSYFSFNIAFYIFCFVVVGEKIFKIGIRYISLHFFVVF